MNLLGVVLVEEADERARSLQEDAGAGPARGGLDAAPELAARGAEPQHDPEGAAGVAPGDAALRAAQVDGGDSTRRVQTTRTETRQRLGTQFH